MLNANALKKKGKITISGWAENIRSMGKIKFVSLRDISGNIQITLVKGKVSDEGDIRMKLRELFTVYSTEVLIIQADRFVREIAALEKARK